MAIFIAPFLLVPWRRNRTYAMAVCCKERARILGPAGPIFYFVLMSFIVLNKVFAATGKMLFLPVW